MSDPVVDASALLALLNEEEGSEAVASVLPGARIGAVNLSEVVGKLAELGMPERRVVTVLEPLGLEVVVFDRELAYGAGALRPVTLEAGLSLGDRACLALAIRLGVRALTADRSWRGLDLDVDVELIR